MESNDLLRYEATFLLSAAGDAMGFRSGKWEFCISGETIHKEADEMGGIMSISIENKEWKVSDDTIMHIATANAIVSQKWKKPINEQFFKVLYTDVCKEYIECLKPSVMEGRAAGKQCIQAVPYLKEKWNSLPYSSTGGGCGAAMRTMCLGLWLHKPEDLHTLIKVSLECGRMTHNHPTGYLGGVVAATFTSFAIQKIPAHLWGWKLMEQVLPLAREYVKECTRDNAIYHSDKEDPFTYFVEKWDSYLRSRNIRHEDNSGPNFPEVYAVNERDEFYKSISYSGWGGSSGHDSVIISYDAFLGCTGSWEEFCRRGILHGGDNDTTGAIGGAWFGAVYGLEGVPSNHVDNIEFHSELKQLAKKIFEISRNEAHPAPQEKNVWHQFKDFIEKIFK